MSSLSLFVISMASVFGWIMARQGFPTVVSGFVLDHAGASNRLAAGFVLLMILAPGFFSEVIALMVIFVPILAPLGAPLGFDPIHWGLLLAMATNVGGITPPVGAHLFSSLRRASPSAASAR